MEEVTGRSRELHNEELHNFHSLRWSYREWLYGWVV